MSTFVLVPGAGHGAWCWKWLIRRLVKAGHEVHTPVLTGVGERASELTPQVCLSTHIDDVVGLFETEDLRGVILTGHSYGGTVITGVADRIPDRIAELVFLDAPQPGHGESILDATPGMDEALEGRIRTVDGVELTLFPDETTVTALGITLPDDIAHIRPQLTPHPLACFKEKLKLRDEARVRSLPRSSIDCTVSLARRRIPDEAQRPPNWRYWQIDTGHNLMILEPDKVGAILNEIAANPGEPLAR